VVSEQGPATIGLHCISYLRMLYDEVLCDVPLSANVPWHGRPCVSLAMCGMSKLFNSKNESLARVS